MSREKLRPPELLSVIGVYIGLGPLLWLLPVTLCSTRWEWSKIDRGFDYSLLLLLPVGFPFLSGVIWWGAVLAGLWYVTVLPTLMAGIAYWLAMRKVAAHWTPASSRRLYRALVSCAVAAITTTAAFSMLIYPGIFKVNFTAVLDAWTLPHLQLSGLVAALALTGAQLGLVIGWWMKLEPTTGPPAGQHD